MPGGGTPRYPRRLSDQRGAVRSSQNGAPYSRHHPRNLREEPLALPPANGALHDTSLRFINYPNAERALELPERLDAAPHAVRSHRSRHGAFRSARRCRLRRDVLQEPPGQFVDPVRQHQRAGRGQRFYLGQGGRARTSAGQATLLLFDASAWASSATSRTACSVIFYNTNKASTAGSSTGSAARRSCVSTSSASSSTTRPRSSTTTARRQPGHAGLHELPRRRRASLRSIASRPSFGLNTTLDYVQQISDTQIPRQRQALQGPTPLLRPQLPPLPGVRWRSLLLLERRLDPRSARDTAGEHIRRSERGLACGHRTPGVMLLSRLLSAADGPGSSRFVGLSCPAAGATIRRRRSCRSRWSTSRSARATCSRSSSSVRRSCRRSTRSAADGTLAFPHIEPFKVAGSSLDRSRRTLRDRLIEAKFLVGPAGSGQGQGVQLEEDPGHRSGRQAGTAAVPGTG